MAVSRPTRPRQRSGSRSTRRRSRTRFGRWSSRRTWTPLPGRLCLPSALDDRLAQAATIARATFDGFLESDLMPSGMQAPALIWAAAFLVGPSIFLPAQNLTKYPMIRRFHPELLERTLWDDRM